MALQNNTKLSLASIMQSTELKKRVLFTLGALALFRLGAHIAIPGIPKDLLAGNQLLPTNLINMYDLFAGGALRTLPIFALGIGPYISASIIMQLLTPVIPHLKELREEGSLGQRKIRQMIRWLTFELATLESFGLATMIAGAHGPGLSMPVPAIIVWVTIILTTSSMFIMWLAESITKRGIGNGSSLLLCIGIAARLPVMINQTWMSVQAGQTPAWGAGLMLAVFILLAAISVVVQEAIRKVTVLGGKQVAPSRTRSVPETQLYLTINPAGVMPIVFASQFMLFFGILLSFTTTSVARLNQFMIADKNLGPVWSFIMSNPCLQVVSQTLYAELQNFLVYTHWEHCFLYGLLIVYFTLFYSSIVLPAKDIADSLRKDNRAVAGLKPGRPTRDFFTKTINRLSLIGATAMMFIAVLPIQAAQFCQVQTLVGFGSTSLIILTGVALDTQRQAITHALNSRYHKRHLLRPTSEDSSPSQQV